MTQTVISLFSGAGGLDLGVDIGGGDAYECVARVENDPDCRKTLIANNAELKTSKTFYEDIRDVNAKRLLKDTGLKKDQAFLVIGGPPCQSFSSAGLRSSVNSENGSVVTNYFEIIRGVRPRFFVFENVRGLLSAAIKHKPLTEREHPQEVAENEDERLGSVMSKIVLPSFRRLGYEVVYGVLCSADYGSPQVRHRIIFLGSRDREFKAGVFRKQTSRAMTALDLLPPTHHRFAAYGPIEEWRTLRDAIWHLRDRKPASNDCYTYSTERKEIFRLIPPGKNWKWIRDNEGRFSEKFLKEIMGGAFYSGGGKEGFWRRLSWEKPAPTLTTQPQQLASSLCHPDHERPLSIPEYALLQDFPDNYVFEGTKSSRYKQIGNAVPVNMAIALGRFFRQFI